jgi:hypothetical protein
MSSPLELYRLWRDMQDAHVAYRDAKNKLTIIAREAQGLASLVDADGCRWKITVGYGPTPIVNVQAIAHLDDVTGPPGSASIPET